MNYECLLTLPLFVAWILFVDHIQPALAPHNLALFATFFN